MSNKYVLSAIVATGLLVPLQSCHRNTPREYTDTYTAGNLKLVADESFAPIVGQELYIFGNDNPSAHTQVAYRSENDAVKYLLADSCRFAFLSRDLTADERSSLRQRNLPAVVNKFAIDAVAVIVNSASADTATSVDAIRALLKGQGPAGRTVVFDNPNSSLVRYLRELAGVSDFKQKNIYALKTNREVIRYVSEHPEAIGITGFSWVDDPDADYSDAVKRVRVLAVKDEHSKAPGMYFRPSQSTLFLKQYPLQRSLYVVNCTGRKGLGLGLELFVEGDKGQRIILRSGLLPVLIPERNITIHSNKL